MSCRTTIFKLPVYPNCTRCLKFIQLLTLNIEAETVTARKHYLVVRSFNVFLLPVSLQLVDGEYRYYLFTTINNSNILSRATFQLLRVSYASLYEQSLKKKRLNLSLLFLIISIHFYYYLLLRQIDYY